MRISDWSSDVCSSDLLSDNPSLQAAQARIAQARASVRQGKAGRFPTLGTQATAIQGRLPGLDIQNSAPPSASAPVSPQGQADDRSEEHTSELQSLMRISYAVFCLKKKNMSRRIMHTPYSNYTLLDSAT